MDFDSEIAEQYFERGKNRIIFEKYSEAIEDFTKAIELYPNEEIYSEILFMAYYARGFAYKKVNYPRLKSRAWGVKPQIA